MNNAAGCLRCEVLPPKTIGPGVLHLRFPLTHSRAKLLNYLKEGGWEWSEKNDMISVHVPDEDLSPLVAPLMNVLTSTEQADVRVMFQRDGQQIDVFDIFEVDSLESFVAKAQSGWLLDLMSENRLTSIFQPIIDCQNDNSVFAYECLLRGREDNGQVVSPARILDVARGSGLLFQLDREARITSIREAARFNIDCKIFINFIPTSIYDPVNCLRSTVRAVDEMGLRRDQVVFEVTESELVRDTTHLANILNYYRASGFAVALDDLGSGYSSLNLLSQIRPDYIKLDRDLIRDITTDNFKALIAQKLLEAAHELDVLTIAEGIETRAEWEWLRDHHARYIQGYFVARPASPPPLLDTRRFVLPDENGSSSIANGANAVLVTST